MEGKMRGERERESCLGRKNEGRKGNEKLYVLERKKKKDIFSQLDQLFCFLTDGLSLQICWLF